MIARRTQDRTSMESDFERLAHYILRTGKKENIDGYRISNCGFNDDPELAIKEVLATQARNTRSDADPCYHLYFAFPAGEKPDMETLEQLEDELCAAIGLEDHQRIAAIHNDTDHYHVHVAINKVHPVLHTMIEPHYDKLKLVDAVEKLEIKHGLVKQIDWEAAKERRAERYALGLQASDQATEDMKAHTGQLPFKDWVAQRRELITDAIDNAQSWDELHQNLAPLDLTIKAKGNGANLVARTAGVHIKLSELGRDYSKPKLEKRLGKIQEASEAVKAIPPVSRYNKPPIEKKSEQNPLWEAYQQREKAKKIALAQVRQARQAAYTAQSKEYQQKRIAIKHDPILTAPFKRQAYQLAAASNKKRRTQIKEQFGKQQQAIFEQYPERNWQSFLINQAEAGNDEALALLRKSRKNHYLADQLAVSGEVKAEGQRILTAMNPEVRKSGNVIYEHKGVQIRDDGEKLAIDQQDTLADKATTIALLRMARQQYGDELTVEGSEAWKQQVVEVAVAEEMPVTFKDPQMERKRQVLEAALSEGKPHKKWQSGQKAKDDVSNNNTQGKKQTHRRRKNKGPQR